MMKLRLLGVGIFLMSAAMSSSARASCATERPNLPRAADAFAQELEVFDEVLHGNEAPSKIIAIVHHFEEGFSDFTEVLKSGRDCREAVEEFQHFHLDIHQIYNELDANRAFFYRAPVLKAWNRLLPAYVRFQNQLYRRW